ncbi:MAG: MFS transporter [Pseudomonadota bacterium]
MTTKTAPPRSNPALGRLIAATGLTNLADGIAVVVWAWLGTLLTRDPLLVALMPMALRLPWFLLALPAGIVTDRVDRRRLIVVMDLCRCGGFVAVAMLVWTAVPLPPAPASGLTSPGLFAALLVCAFVIGAAEVFRDNAAQTILPTIVSHDVLEQANGRLLSVELIGNALLGPALGAFLIAAALPLPFAVNAVAFGLSAVFMIGLAGRFRPVRATRAGIAQELREGLDVLRGAPLLRLLAWITGIWNLLHQMVVIALVLHVQENLGLGARAYGLILAAGAVGGILGGIFAARVVRAMGPGAAARWMTLASALAFAAIAMAPNAVVLALVLAAFEFTGLVWNTVSVSYRQRAVPDALLGRVNSLYRMLAWGMMPLGLVLSGVVVRLVDGMAAREVALVAPFWVAAAGVAVLTALVWRPLGRRFAAVQAQMPSRSSV